MSKGDERAALRAAFDKYAAENVGTVFSGRVYSHQAPFYLLLFEAGWQARGQQEPLTDEQILLTAATLPAWLRYHPELEPDDLIGFARAILKAAHG